VDAPTASGLAAQTGWSARRTVSAGLLLRLRPIGLALRATPARQPVAVAPPLLCEEGNVFF